MKDQNFKIHFIHKKHFQNLYQINFKNFPKLLDRTQKFI